MNDRVTQMEATQTAIMICGFWIVVVVVLVDVMDPLPMYQSMSVVCTGLEILEKDPGNS